MADDQDNQFAPPMWTDEQASPAGFGDASMEASPSPMRPTSGSASGPSPVDTPSPAKSAADEGFGMMHRPEPVEPSPQGPPPSGKQQFHDTMADFGHAAEKNRAALMTLDPADPQFREKMADLQLQHGAITTEKARYQMLHPWGGPESAHPGVLGKIGHVAGEIGNAVGNAELGPRVMSEIPGSEANLQAKATGGEAETEKAIGNQQKIAQAGQQEAKAGLEKEQAKVAGNPKPEKPESPQQVYADAVQDALNRGVDPNTDPHVMQVADTITSIQKEPTPKTENAETQFVDEYRAKHPGASIAEGQRAFKQNESVNEPGNYVPVNDAKGGTIGWVDPKSKHFVSVQDVKGVGVPSGQGSPAAAPSGAIPPKPTSQERNVQAQAGIAAEGIPQVVAEIDKLKDQLGPVAGRWNEFMQGKVGMENPEMAGLRADLLMVSSAVALAHARGRLPENLRAEFDHAINAPKQDPENLKAVLNHILPWMQRMQNMTDVQGAGNPSAAPNAAPKQSFADWKNSQKPSVGGP
jgi:hypothetical protein